MERRDSVKLLTTNVEIQFQTMTTPSEVARLWVEDGQLRFKGNADVAARVMFDMLRDAIDEYVAERLAV